MDIKVYVLNSFARVKDGGNPAGVVTDCDNLSEKDMLDVSQKVGFSETAFVQKSDKADFKVRFFTPAAEVDLCGHATIASFSLLRELNVLSVGTYTQETKAGVIKIEVRDDGFVMMGQPAPKFYEVLDGKIPAECLNISTGDLITGLPVQIVSTGLKDILVPVKSLNVLSSLEPDHEKITEASREYDVIGIHAFTPESMFNSAAHCRNFAPLYGIPEESATGTSNGALSCYLYKYGLIDGEQAKHVVIEQGYSMGRPSEIISKLDVRVNEIVTVQVGGKAFLDKQINIRV